MKYRLKYKRCSEVIHHLLLRDGYKVSLSSVKRTLRRVGLIKRSPWKRWHRTIPRPLPEKPGILIQVDTLHIGQPLERVYVYSLIDVCTRWAYTLPTKRINTHQSLEFIRKALKQSPFVFKTLHSDHGSEFSTYFTEHIQKQRIAHRHSRVREPSDNGHIERFLRTLQEECLNNLPRSLRIYRKEIPEYVHYSNTERLHLALGLRTPLEVMQSY